MDKRRFHSSSSNSVFTRRSAPGEDNGHPRNKRSYALSTEGPSMPGSTSWTDSFTPLSSTLAPRPTRSSNWSRLKSAFGMQHKVRKNMLLLFGNTLVIRSDNTAGPTSDDGESRKISPFSQQRNGHLGKGYREISSMNCVIMGQNHLSSEFKSFRLRNLRSFGSPRTQPAPR